MTNISITTKELRLAYQATQELSNTKLPVKASYWVSRVGSKLKADFEASEKERTALITEHGEVDEQGNSFIKSESKEAITAYITAWLAIEDTVVELSIVPTINIDLFGNVEIQPAILSALEHFITE
jgi:hypothetical protein